MGTGIVLGSRGGGEAGGGGAGQGTCGGGAGQGTCGGAGGGGVGCFREGIDICSGVGPVAVGRRRCRWGRGGRFLLLPGGAGPLPRGLGEGVQLVQVGDDHVHPESQAVDGPDHLAQARFLGFRAGALRLFAHLHRGAFPGVLRGDSRLEGTGCAGGGIGKIPGRPAVGPLGRGGSRGSPAHLSPDVAALIFLSEKVVTNSRISPTVSAVNANFGHSDDTQQPCRSGDRPITTREFV